jgi:K+ transporter
MLTPAVSVTSAVAGIALTRPALIPNINNISVGFIVALFLIQRFGTAKVSMFFSPGLFTLPCAISFTDSQSYSYMCLAPPPSGHGCI